MGFHLDTTGNIWLGSGSSGDTLSDAISAGPPNFYVTSAGSLFAKEGSIGGIDINASDIQSSNYSSGTAGFKIEGSGGAEFNGPILSFGKETGTPSGASTTSIKLGDAVLFSRDEGSAGNHLFSTKPFVVMADGSEDNPSLTIQGDYEKMGFFLVTQTDFNFDTFKLSNGDDDIWSVNSNSTTFTVLGNLTVDGSTLTVNGDSGTSGQYLGKDSNGTLGYHDITGGTVGINAGTGIAIDNTNDAISVVYGNTTNTSSRGNHDHDSSYLTNSHTSASNPHPVYVQALNHSHSNFLESADLSSYATNTALQAKLDATHSLNVYDHNAFLTSNNLPNNVLTNDNHTSHSGFLSVNHSLNSYDHSSFVTQNNIDFGNHNHNVPNHNHAYSSIGHGHSYASTNHNHNYAASDHNHSYAATSHNHAYASSFHNHSSISNHTHSYAALNHSHSGNQTFNAWMHDDRFLSVNANSVPGLNVINRLNPVTANFNEGYVDRMIDDMPDENYRNSGSSMKRKTYRITVQDVEQALIDDGIDTNDVAWLIDRLYYVDPWLEDEPAEKQAHGAKGLLNGEFEAVLVQAVKDLSAKIDTLEDRIATLEG